MSRNNWRLLLLLAPLLAAPALAAGPNDVLPEAPAKALVVRACTSCHQAPQFVAKRHTAEEWDELVAKMVDRGARLTEAEQDQVYAYLVRYFGPRPTAKPG
jgi:hypothetical protein